MVRTRVRTILAGAGGAGELLLGCLLLPRGGRLEVGCCDHAVEQGPEAGPCEAAVRVRGQPRVDRGPGGRGADVVIEERAGSHGDIFWRREFPLMAVSSFRR